MRFRLVTVEDAAFIHRLRCDPANNAWLSATSGRLADQIKWLAEYERRTDDAYYIIETKAGAAVGTVRLYRPQEHSFCWGSLILAGDYPRRAAAEVMAMVYSYALALGFTAAHFEARTGNTRVWGWHERLGARLVSADALERRYVLDLAGLKAIIAHYADLLPDGITLPDWPSP